MAVLVPYALVAFAAVVYNLVDTEDEARERLDSESYDLVVYSSEFRDSAKLQSGW